MLRELFSNSMTTYPMVVTSFPSYLSGTASRRTNGVIKVSLDCLLDCKRYQFVANNKRLIMVSKKYEDIYVQHGVVF